MKLNKIGCLLTSCLVLATHVAVATVPIDISNQEYITKLATRTNGIHTVTLENSLSNSSTCDKNYGGVFDENNDTAGKSLYAIALSASISSMKVKLDTQGCLDDGDGSTFPHIIKIRVFTPAP